MRIPSGVTDQYIYFVAVDATDFTTRETGLTGFTVYRSRNGAAAAAMTTPTVNEVDATNMPGVYELLLDEDMTIGAGNDSEEMVFHITASGMAPVTRTIELYRLKITAGETLTVATGVGEANVASMDNNVITSSVVANNAFSNSAFTTGYFNSINAECDTALTDYDAVVPADLPANFADLSITATTGRVDVASIAGTAQTANDNGADINAILVDTNALNDIKIPQTLNLTASGNIGIDWANVENPTSIVDLSATDIQLCDTVTTNSDMRGTDNALLASSAPTNFGDMSISVTTGLVDITQTAADKVWGTAARTLTANTNLNDPTAASIADAVWDEAQADHTTVGTFGEVATEVASIQTDTGTTLDTIVDNLNLGIIYGTAQTGTLSTTQATSDLTGYADDQLIGRVIVWTSGNCDGEVTDITDYANASGLLTFTALTTAPANGDTFKIV